MVIFYLNKKNKTNLPFSIPKLRKKWVRKIHFQNYPVINKIVIKYRNSTSIFFETINKYKNEALTINFCHHNIRYSLKKG